MILETSDEFTGITEIRTQFVGIRNFKFFEDRDDIEDDDDPVIFQLVLRKENNESSNMAMVICFHEEMEWADWEEKLYLIIDNDRFYAPRTFKKLEKPKLFKRDFLLYELSSDLLHLICNSKEIKYSLRGNPYVWEGHFSDSHLIFFKAFENYCLEKNEEGASLIESLM
jgi:hypothetical protein